MIVVHAHITESFGGTEHAAFALHNWFYQQTDQNIESWIVSPGDRGLSENDYHDHRILSTNEPWDLKCTNPDKRDAQLKPLLERIQPHIIHLHHYIHFGIDIIEALGQLCPSAKIILTLHEYLLLCPNDGHMITRTQQQICTKPSTQNCNICFPYKNKDDFVQRSEATQKALNNCHGLISPSEWLMQQFQHHRSIQQPTAVIENGLPMQLLQEAAKSCSDIYSATASLNRFAFFGRASERKGILILLSACYQLSLTHPGRFNLQIHGGGMEQEPASIQHRIHHLLNACNGHVQIMGRYRQCDIPQLMNQCDWVIIPSIWWENSPVVIQESFAAGTPVIGTGHGGIAEKIENRGGICFRNGDARHLASRMTEALGNHQLHESLVSQMSQPTSIQDSANQHLAFYRQVLQHYEFGSNPE